MAIYGVDNYGIGKYGASPNENAFLTDFFEANPIGAWYDVPSGATRATSAILAIWDTPPGNWQTLRLVRNQFGYPVSEHDGDILLELSSGAGRWQYTDYDISHQDFWYYGLWIYDGTNWQLSGNTFAFSVRDNGYSQRLYDLIPEIYKRYDLELTGAIEQNVPLMKFMAIFGWGFDYLKGVTDQLTLTSNPQRAPLPMLQQLAYQYGAFYEPQISSRLARLATQNATHLNQIKGTPQGIEDTVNAITGWSAQVTIGNNMMLSSEQASFESSAGTFVKDSHVTQTQPGTSTWGFYTLGSPPITFTLSPVGGFQNPLNPSDTGSNALVLKNTSGSTGTIGARSSVGNTQSEFSSGAARNAGIPIIQPDAGSVYTASLYVRANTTVRTYHLFMDWYDDTDTWICRTDDSWSPQWYGMNWANTANATDISTIGSGTTGFSTYVGTWFCHQGLIYPSVATAYPRYIINTTSTETQQDIYMTIKGFMTPSTDPGIVVRYTDVNNLIVCGHDKITVINAGTPTNTSYSSNFVAGDRMHVRNDMVGNTVTVFKNNSQVATISSSFNNTQKHWGFRL